MTGRLDRQAMSVAIPVDHPEGGHGRDLVAIRDGDVDVDPAQASSPEMGTWVVAVRLDAGCGSGSDLADGDRGHDAVATNVDGAGGGARGSW